MLELITITFLGQTLLIQEPLFQQMGQIQLTQRHPTTA